MDAIRDFAPEVLEEFEVEFEYSAQARRLSEILEWERYFFRQLWYVRHCELREDIESGIHRVVSGEKYDKNPSRLDQTLDTVWARALEAAKQTEDELGIENLGPWDDFELGMINGKLSALRWVLGDEWDMLDT